MKRNIFTTASVLALTVAMSVNAFAAVKVTVDGKDVEFPTAPVIEEGNTLVPMKQVFEALGANVVWNDADKSVTATAKDGSTIYLKIGSNKMMKDGTTEIALNAPAKIMEDRTFVPLRAVSEAFGADVQWNGDAQLVTITSQIQQPAAPTEPSTPSETVTKTFTIEKATMTEEVKGEDGKVAFTTSINYPVIKEDTQAAKSINASFKEFAELLVKGTIDENKEDALKTYKDVTATLNSSVDYVVTFNKDGVLSVLFEMALDMGGAHPIKSRIAATYDMNTGKEMDVTNIFAITREDAKKMVVEAFTSDIKKNPASYNEDALETLEGNVNVDEFYVMDEGLIFFVQPYGIAPYSEGFPEVLMPRA